jgi:uncharacterized protein YdeI (YjbR/CyaY-like superfamily)
LGRRSPRGGRVLSDAPTLTFPSPDAWREWLEEHHGDQAGCWIKIGKKGTGIESVTHAEALDIAIAHGWIDGKRMKHDDETFLQRFTPRRARSSWSQINRDKAIAHIEAGTIHPAGLREVEKAKADGRWENAYEPQSRAAVPDDLQAELDRNPAAAEFFTTLSSQNRYAILFRLRDAKRPETRARRLEKFVTMLARGETVYPQ